MSRILGKIEKKVSDASLNLASTKLLPEVVSDYWIIWLFNHQISNLKSNWFC